MDETYGSPKMKPEAEVPKTCILLFGQQGATHLVAKKYFGF